MARWMLHMDGGPRRVNHAAVCIDEFIYSFGGFCTGDDFTVRRDIEVDLFNLRTYKWHKLKYAGDNGSIPYQRYGHTAVAYKDSCFIYGGRNDIDGVSAHVYKFNIGTKTWYKPQESGGIPFARDGHSCCVVGNKMYLFAGFEENSLEFSNSIYAFNLDTYEWNYCPATGPHPQWRDFHTATPYKHYMVVFGGRSDQNGPYHSDDEVYYNDVYLFNTIELHWIKPNVKGDIPVGRRSHNAFEYDGKIYIFGGYNSITTEHFNSMHAYDPELCVWTKFTPCGLPPRVRRRSCCCLVSNLVVFFGGTSPETKLGLSVLNDLSDLHILDLSPSLQTLCMDAIVKFDIEYTHLPENLRDDLQLINKTSVSGGSRVPHG